jgi:hypothetical protein
MYSENVILQGNHTVFSGISSYAVDILRAFIDIIYSGKDRYPKEFIKRAIGGISFLLNFGDLIAKEYNIKGYNKISFAEICRLIDNGTLNEFYGDPAKEKFFYNS